MEAMNQDNEDGPQIECTLVPPVPKEREFLLRLSESDLRTLRGIAHYDVRIPEDIAASRDYLSRACVQSLLNRLRVAASRALA